MKLDKILDYAPLELIESKYVAGVDEVGRGCGAGPVVTAAVILPKDFSSPLLRDSKKLTPKQRKEAYELILEKAICISCNAGSVLDVDSMGINPATFKTMTKCLNELTVTPDVILLDGIVWDKASNYEVVLVPKGDDTYMSIAAAAIVAKVRRDEYMGKLHELHPEYDWKNNMGYLTPKHIEGIKSKGVTRYHRKEYVKNFI